MKKETEKEVPKNTEKPVKNKSVKKGEKYIFFPKTEKSEKISEISPK